MLKKIAVTACLLSTLSAHALGLGVSIGAGEPLGLFGLSTTTTTYVYAGPVAGIVMLAKDGEVVTQVKGEEALELLELEVNGELSTDGGIIEAYASHYGVDASVIRSAVESADPLTIENLEAGL